MSANYKKTIKEKRSKAKKLMTTKQYQKCHAIIHSASVISAAAGAIPIPIADALPISFSQTSMVLFLGKVFNQTITESTAKGIISAAASTLFGRNLVKFIPVVGWGISAAVAAGITEAIGWMAALDFAKGNYTDGFKAGYNDASKEYKAKFTKQAKEFAKQADNWAKTEQEWKKSEEETNKLLDDCLKYISELEKERESLMSTNKTLTKEKQELLEKLYEIRAKLCA